MQSISFPGPSYVRNKATISSLFPIQGGRSWDSETLREKLESIFEKLEPYQSKLKVGYEARYFITMTVMFIARIQTLGTALEATLPYYIYTSSSVG